MVEDAVGGVRSWLEAFNAPRRRIEPLGGSRDPCGYVAVTWPGLGARREEEEDQ